MLGSSAFQAAAHSSVYSEQIPAIIFSVLPFYSQPARSAGPTFKVSQDSAHFFSPSSASPGQVTIIITVASWPVSLCSWLLMLLQHPEDSVLSQLVKSSVWNPLKATLGAKAPVQLEHAASSHLLCPFYLTHLFPSCHPSALFLECPNGASLRVFTLRVPGIGWSFHKILQHFRFW